MKKAKFLTMFAALLAMGLTACGGSKPSAEPSSEPQSEQSQPSSSKASVAPSSSKSSAAPSSSSQAAPVHVHEWGEAVDVAGNDEAGTVGYKKYECKTGDAVKIEVKLDDSMLAEGSENKNDPEGYLKLKSNDQSWSFKFSYDEEAEGLIYQRGVMDNWSSNLDKNIFSSGRDGGADDFELTVNEKKVDISKYKSNSFADMMPGDTQEGNLSPLSDVESGEIALVAGVNTVSYKRVASMNLALTHIVFIVDKTPVDYLQPLPRTWVETATLTNSDEKEYIQLKDETKNKVGVKISVKNYIVGEGAASGTALGNDGKISPVNDKTAILTYKVKAPKAGEYQVILRGKSSSNATERTLNERSLAITVNGVSADIQGERTPLTAEQSDFVGAPTVNLTGEEDVITLVACDYRIQFDVDGFIIFAEH